MCVHHMASVAAVRQHVVSNAANNFHHHHLRPHTGHSSGGGTSDDDGSVAAQSPGGTATPPPSPSPGGREEKGSSSSLLETPTRKNKRKLSEPRKRGDFSIKRLCPDSPGGGSAMSESGCSDDGGDTADNANDNNHDDHHQRHPHHNRNNRRHHNNNNSSSINHHHHHRHHSRGRTRRRLSHDQDGDSSSRGGLSEREEDNTPGSSGGVLSAAAGPLGGGGGGGSLPGAPHHPFFPAGIPPFMPGFYLAAADGHRATGFPPPPFPGLPLGLGAHPGLSNVMASDVASAARNGGGGGSHGGGNNNGEGSADVMHPSSRGPGHPQQHHPLHPHHHPHHLGLPGAVDPLSRAESPDNLSGDEADSTNGGGSGGRRPRKNYKNMTRERRVEANARERTRVHTISAAFDALRRAVPSYSYNQKLSKLAILRIACTYIMALARLADVDCSSAEPVVPVTFADCVDLCTRTIQTEGRARRRH